MDVGNLIKIVRKHPVIYDKSHHEFKNFCSKWDIWNLVGKEMGVDGSVCSQTWYTFKRNYKNYLKKQNTTSGLNMIKPYLKQLEFFKKYFVIEGIENCEEYEDNRQDDIAVNHPYVSDNEDSDCQPPPLKRKKNTSSVDILARHSSTQTAAAALIENLHNNENQATSQNPVDAFLTGIAPTLKALTPMYLHLAKSEIFNIVQKYEMKILMPENSYEERVDVNILPNETVLSDPYSTSLASVATVLAPQEQLIPYVEDLCSVKSEPS